MVFIYQLQVASKNSKMKNILSFLSLILIITSISCDKVDDPFPSELGKSIYLKDTEYIVDKVLGVGNTNQLNSFIDDNTWESSSAPDNSSTKFVLLEEFTGHKCTFCPRGTREIIRLDGIYGDTLIPVSIHAGSFAIPEINTGKFFTDFRVEGGHGETYIGLFKTSTYPSGVINRVGDASNKDDWDLKIKTSKSNNPAAILKMTNYYSSAASAVRSEIEITWLKNKTEDLNLQLYLLEDHILDWQKDVDATPEANSTYDHRHLLRKVINDTFGKDLQKLAVGETEKITYIFSVNGAWKPDDLEVVAFIFNNDVNNRNVLQANAAHVK